MNHQTAKPAARDVGLSGALVLFSIAFYLFFKKGVLDLDEGTFIEAYQSGSAEGRGMIFHLLFGHFLHGVLKIGDAVGATPVKAGVFQSALFMALAQALFFALLRRYGVGAGLSFLYAVLLGLNATSILNATSVELYGVTLFCIVLSLHAFANELRAPSRRRAFVLYLSCLLIALFHLGFSLWVLAIYLALAWKERAFPVRSAWRIAQGGLVLAVVLIWMWHAGFLSIESKQVGESFFKEHWQKRTSSGLFLPILEAPLFSFAAYAGFILFPAWLGWGALRRRLPDEANFMLAVTLLFFPLYSFWVPDSGTFFLPLQTIWGLFGALGLGLLIDRLDRRGAAVLFLGTAVYYLIFMQLSKLYLYSMYPPFKWALALAFWLLCIGLGLIGAELGKTTARPKEPNRFFMGLYGAGLLAFSSLAYLPEANSHRQTDEKRTLLDAFSQIAPDGARLVTYVETHRVFARTGHESMAVFTYPDDSLHWKKNAEQLTQWIRDAGSEESPALIFDSITHFRKKELWERLPPIEIPLDKLVFTPIQSGEINFYSVGFADPNDADYYSLGEDLFAPEDWGGITVQWTKKTARIEFQPMGNTLVAKYYVAHPDVSPENPVMVKFHLDGGATIEISHSETGVREARLELKENHGEAGTLMINVDRTFNTDGRDLGIAMYPLDFE